MLKVRNKHTGIETWYPDNQAHWLVRIGKCELVQDKGRPEADPAPKAKPKAKKGTYKTKDMKAETQDVAIQPEAEVTE